MHSISDNTYLAGPLCKRTFLSRLEPLAMLGKKKKLNLRLKIRRAGALQPLEGLPMPSFHWVLLNKWLGVGVGGRRLLLASAFSFPLQRCSGSTPLWYSLLWVTECTQAVLRGGKLSPHPLFTPMFPPHSNVAMLQLHSAKPIGSTSAGRLWWFLQTHGADWQIDFQAKGQCREPKG